jgi:pectin methylesterase-like acyl-CoA thioesterase
LNFVLADQGAEMAVLRNGVALLVALVATAFVASAVSAEAGCDCPTAAPSSDCSWNCYAAAEGTRQANHQLQASQGIESADGTVTTSALPASGYTITVDKWGKGNFWTIQDAINSIAEGNTKRVIIKINDGVYRYSLTSYN